MREPARPWRRPVAATKHWYLGRFVPWINAQKIMRWFWEPALLLHPTAELSAAVTEIAQNPAAEERFWRRVHHHLYRTRRRITLQLIVGIGGPIVVFALAAAAIIGGSGQFDGPLALASIAAEVLWGVFILTIVVRHTRAEPGLVMALIPISRAVQLATRVLDHPHDLELREQLAESCNAAAAMFLRSVKEQRPKPSKTTRAMAKSDERFRDLGLTTPAEYKKRWRQQSKLAAGRLKSYTTMLLEGDDYWVGRVRDDYTKVMLRLVCGSWLELNQPDIGVPGELRPVRIPFWRGAAFWTVVTSVLASVATIVAAVLAVQS